MNSDPGHRLILRCLLLLLVAAACASAPGCVRRRLTVRTTPPGSLLYVDDQFVGATPVSTDFTYYGTRKIQLIKDGFETQTVKQEFLPPWYEYPPLDFVNENFNPYEIRDERELHFTLAAQRIVPPGELLGRADYLRGSARQGVVTPMPQSGAGAWSASGISGDAPPTTIAPSARARSWTGPAQQDIPREEIPEGYVRPPPGSTVLPPSSGPSAPFTFAPSQLETPPAANSSTRFGPAPSQLAPPQSPRQVWPD